MRATAVRKAWICAFLTLSILASGVSAAETGFSATSGRPFAIESVWNSPVPQGPALDANSDTIVAGLSGAPAVADLVNFGIPIYEADAQTPRVTVECTEPWGQCPVAGQIPIPAGSVPHKGSDGAMVVIDRSADASFEFWRATPPTGSGNWTTSWGAVTHNLTNGNGVLKTESGSPGDVVSGATKAGVSRLAGVIRLREIQAGSINHALVFSSSKTCTAQNFRFPAVGSDGTSSSSCIPLGAHVFLPSATDISGLSGAERTVAQALKTYGAYVIDSGGAPIAISFEVSASKALENWNHVEGGPGVLPDSIYYNAGLRWDYYGMQNVPWSSLKVLATWNGAPTPVSSVSAAITSSTTASVTWTAANQAASYKIWRYAVSTGAWTQVGSVSAPTGTFNDSGLSPSSSYQYAVRAVSSGGTISGGVDSQTVATPVVYPPSNLQVSGTSRTSISLRWTGSPDAVTYRVWRASPSDWNSWTFVPVGAQMTTYSDTGLDPGTTYAYSVRAVNSGGVSSNGSNLVQDTTARTTQ